MACRRATGCSFASAANRHALILIFYFLRSNAWLNDEATLRKAGAKTDVYAVFQRMLRRGEVPSGIEELNKRGSAIDV